MGADISFYDYLKLLAPKITDELVLTCVGGVGKDWEGLRPHEGNLHQTYMAGTSALALGIAVALPHRRVISLDTDGSILMGLGILPVIAKQNPSNLIIIVCDNECYEAAGKIPSHTASVTRLAGMAREAGIKNTTEVKELPGFQEAIVKAFTAKGASLIVAKVTASHPKLPYYNVFSVENKFRFVRYIEKTENLRILGLPKIKI